MLELTGLGSVFRGVGLLYWLLAIGVVAFAVWKAKTQRAKLVWAGIAIAAFGFLPAKVAVEQLRRIAYEKEAWAYFKKKCETEAGEKIYKTVPSVKSVLVVKPLPPATEKDLYDQFWYGDPYSLPATSNRVVRAAGLLTLDSKREHRILKGLRFVEIKNSPNGDVQYQRISSPPGHSDYLVEEIQKPVSQYGVSWIDMSKPEDRKYWVAGSRLQVIDLTDQSIVAERIGYFIEAGFGSLDGARRPWLASRGPNTTCPSIYSDYTDQQFISRVFESVGEK